MGLFLKKIDIYIEIYIYIDFFRIDRYGTFYFPFLHGSHTVRYQCVTTDTQCITRVAQRVIDATKRWQVLYGGVKESLRYK